MPKVTFTPTNIQVEVADETKVLISARMGQVPLRYGCASCRCGTCAVAVTPGDSLLPMKDLERELLARMKLETDGTIRLSCQAKVKADVTINVAFQDTYSPDAGDEF